MILMIDITIPSLSTWSSIWGARGRMPGLPNDQIDAESICGKVPPYGHFPGPRTR